MTSMGSARVRDTTRRLQVAITTGRWPINSQIPNEASLATELGVGRSTVREAVRSLAHVGMLEPAPGRGTFVRSLNPVRGVLSEFAAEHSFADILAVRRGLEVQAATLAAQRCTDADLDRLRRAHGLDTDDPAGATDAEADCHRSPGQFHATVVDLAGNRLLAELYSGLLGAVRHGITTGAVRHGVDDEQRRREHGDLLEAIAARDADRAAAVAAAHAQHDLVVVETADRTG